MKEREKERKIERSMDRSIDIIQHNRIYYDMRSQLPADCCVDTAARWLLCPPLPPHHVLDRRRAGDRRRWRVGLDRRRAGDRRRWRPAVGIEDGQRRWRVAVGVEDQGPQHGLEDVIQACPRAQA